MTREEAIKILLKRQGQCKVIAEYANNAPKVDKLQEIEAINLALTALRPVSREQVERMRGEWMFKPFYKGTSRGAIECQECKGAFEGSVGFNFCPNCGAPMTDEAVQMVMERLEALYE